MAGAGKKRQAKERHTKKDDTSSNDKTGASSSNELSPSQRASPPSRMDGNRDMSAPRERSRSNASQPASGGPSQVVAVRFSGENKNLDLGFGPAAMIAGYGDVSLPKRPQQNNKSGREVNVRLNTFHVVQYPQKPVYQYDVLVGNGAEKKGLVKTIWESKTVQKTLKDGGWIFDGNKLAWSYTDNKGELRLQVDLDAEEGKPPRKDKKTGQPKPDIHRVVIKQTKKVDFASLRAYLQNQANFSNACFEAINFLDHLMRETPSKKFTSIKRNFFARGQTRILLGQGVEAFKGVYASMRPVALGVGQQGGLSVNVDVANTTFWTESPLHITAQNIVGSRDTNHLAQQIAAGRGGRTPQLMQLRSLRKVRVYTTHREPRDQAMKNTWTIDSVLNSSARTYTFTPEGKAKISIADYFRNTYKPLQFPDLPVVQMTKKNIVLPMEVCVILQNQRYPYKLSDKQTMEMIKFAVTLPEVRWGHIQEGVNMLNWGADQHFATYGLKISPTPTAVKARLLPNPKVAFQGRQEDPRTSGRWDLRGKVFAAPHKEPLKSWGVCIIPGRFAVNQDHVKAFLSTFMTVFAGHGGKIANKTPLIQMGGQDHSKNVELLWNAVGNANQARPQLLVFIVPDKNAENYNRIKKSCDCRYGVVSQVLQSAHVQKNQAQYCSNVCMKVNAKLGGYTAKAVGMSKPFTRPTMVIGADVSHGSPGSDAASIAALTVSWDREAIRYAGVVETNGSRVEMITKANIDSMLTPLVNQWVLGPGNGNLPQHIFYFRDGVSEGQYLHVLTQEVQDMRQMFRSISPKSEMKFTVVVASKRHHVRLFPDKASGDRNGNPQPGTLVENGVTHPFEYDFYLCAHSAIKGTARPVHYHVLLDEAKLGVEELQNMIYEHSYQYVRSTTPVSQIPAVYYAHLAAARGISHLDQVARASDEVEDKTRTSNRDPIDIKPVLPMPNQGGIRGVMWYI